MSKIVILNYENCSVDIIDFKELNVSEEDWFHQHYDEDECYYMIAEDQELSINFRSSTQYGNSNS